MTQTKPLDIEKFFQTRNELASKNLNRSTMQAMDKVLQEVIKRRQADAETKAVKTDKTK